MRFEIKKHDYENDISEEIYFEENHEGEFYLEVSRDEPLYGYKSTHITLNQRRI